MRPRVAEGVLVLAVALDGLLLEEAEDVVEDVVAVGLLGEEEGLHELAPGLAAVGHLADDLDDDAAVGGGLGVDGVDEDLAVFEADGGDLVVYFLGREVEREKRALHGAKRVGGWRARTRTSDAHAGDSCR